MEAAGALEARSIPDKTRIRDCEMVIYDTDHVQVVYKPGASDTILCTFSSLGMFKGQISSADGSMYWGKAFIDKSGFGAIGFVAKRRHWFCNDDMPRACTAARGFISQYQTAIGYGSSMGAYGALRWSRALGTDLTVAFGPQQSIDPSETSDRRYSGYLSYFRENERQAMALKSEWLGGRLYIFYDPFDREDRIHAERILSLRCEHSRPIQAFMCGHECVRAFAGADIANELIALALCDDVVGLAALATRVRRRSAIRSYVLMEHLMRSRPQLARAIYNMYQAKFDTGQRASAEARFKILQA